MSSPTFVQIRQSSVLHLKRVVNLPMAALVAVPSKMLFVARMDNIAVHQVCRCSNHFLFCLDLGIDFSGMQCDVKHGRCLRNQDYKFWQFFEPYLDSDIVKSLVDNNQLAKPVKVRIMLNCNVFCVVPVSLFS